jgi:hypothetical protein
MDVLSYLLIKTVNVCHGFYYDLVEFLFIIRDEVRDKENTYTWVSV